ncbi:MAG TPA: DUF1844 domain-containing protein [Candidatus Eisenbacteria bacterium]|nr:DUF1844 domain-containing protein [Candidatus Eisenbacteria bacterium]
MSEDRESELFQALAVNLFHAAWMSLGKIPHPLSGKLERDLGGARTAIDTLSALEVRSRGNRTEAENRLFERALGDLRLNYLDEVKKGEYAKADGETPAAGPEATA